MISVSVYVQALVLRGDSVVKERQRVSEGICGGWRDVSSGRERSFQRLVP